MGKKTKKQANDDDVIMYDFLVINWAQRKWTQIYHMPKLSAYIDAHDLSIFHNFNHFSSEYAPCVLEVTQGEVIIYREDMVAVDIPVTIDKEEPDDGNDKQIKSCPPGGPVFTD